MPQLEWFLKTANNYDALADFEPTRYYYNWFCYFQQYIKYKYVGLLLSEVGGTSSG